jgi:hypothetical protein
MDTFRISKDFIRRQAIISWLSLFAVAIIVGYQLQKDRSDPAISLAGGLGVVLFATFYIRRSYKKRLTLDLGHSLVLTPDAVLLRDSATETRVPYSSIERMKVHKALIGDYWFSLRVTGLGEAKYYGYEDVRRLILQLADKLGSERISGRLPGAST